LEHFSHHVARFIAEHGGHIASGKNEKRFVESTFRVSREVFNVNPVLKVEQFLKSVGAHSGDFAGSCSPSSTLTQF
jgi:Centrosomal spindle body, CEP44